MRVVIGDVDGATCATVAAEIGAGVLGLPLDVRDRREFEAFLDRAEDAVGPLDVLVNNAGIAPIGLFVDENPADTARLLDINLGGVLTGSSLALQRFLPRRHGHIVNLASSAGQIATAGAPPTPPPSTEWSDSPAPCGRRPGEPASARRS